MVVGTRNIPRNGWGVLVTGQDGRRRMRLGGGRCSHAVPQGLGVVLRGQRVCLGVGGSVGEYVALCDIVSLDS